MSDFGIRFERGLLVREDPPSYGRNLWTRHPGTGQWVTDPVNNTRLGVPFGDAEAVWQPIPLSRARLRPLRDNQQAAVDAWNAAGKRGILVMPTGTGKTEVAFHIVRQIASSTLFVVPTRALGYQLAERLEEAFPSTEIGFIGDNTYRIAPLTVATYESAAIKMEHIGSTFKLLVFDECHHLRGHFLSDAARMSAAPYRLGLTATLPGGRDERAAERQHLIGPVCYELPLSAVRGLDLADYKITRIPVFLTDAEQAEYDRLGQLIRQHFLECRERQPGYDWEALRKDLAADPKARHVFLARLRRRFIEEYAEEKLAVVEDLLQTETRQTVIFTGSNLMARRAALRFLIPCILATTGKNEREQILDAYRSGVFRAIIANRVLDEGIDVPSAKVAIVIGGTGSERAAIQRLGRILRKNRGESATLYEVVCAGTKEEERSRQRRRNDAYQS